MRPFTEEELSGGEFANITRIETPQPGDIFDMNKLAVAAVLTLNTMMREFAVLQEKVEGLELELSEFVRGAVQSPPPSKEPKEKPFKLQTLSKEYENG